MRDDKDVLHIDQLRDCIPTLVVALAERVVRSGVVDGTTERTTLLADDDSVGSR